MNDKKVINVAVVGKGSMGRTHSAAISLLDYCYKNLPFKVKLHTLVTRNPETARADADSLGFENYALTYAEAVNNPDGGNLSSVRFWRLSVKKGFVFAVLMAFCILS